MGDVGRPVREVEFEPVHNPVQTPEQPVREAEPEQVPA